MASIAKTSIRKQKKSATSRWLIPLILLLVVVGAGAGYWYWQQNAATTTTKASGPDYKTAQVRRGTISITAAGTGTLVASQQANLNFSTSGTVAKLDAQVSDQVKKGQVLAQLDNLASLQANVNSAQDDLTTAQAAMDTLKQNAASNLANAQIAVINAEKAVTDAQSGVIQPGQARCDDKTTTAYYATYLQLYNNYQKLGDGGGNQDYYLNTLLPAKQNVDQAYQQYIYCAGFTQNEIDLSHAQLSLTQAQLKAAQDTLDLLTKNNGINPTDLASAQNKVDTAQLALDQAKQTLAGATLTAPFDGTIMTVNGKVGDTVGTSAFITIAELAHPQVQFAVDETDMQKVSLNEDSQVSFDALPNRTFSGKVVQINPALQTVNNYQTVQGLIQLDLSKEKDVPNLIAGMTTTVTLVKASAQNVLIVPVQALRDLGGGQYGVFVLQQNQPRLKIVQVGLMDTTNAEIKSGLNAGDVVTTGTTGVNSTGTTGGSSNGTTGANRNGQ